MGYVTGPYRGIALLVAGFLIFEIFYFIMVEGHKDDSCWSMEGRLGACISYLLGWLLSRKLSGKPIHHLGYPFEHYDK